MLICQSSCRGCFAVLAISARCMCRGERCSPVEVISPRQQQGSAAKNSPPTILNLQQILSTGEHCSPLQMLPIVSSAAKSLRSVLVHNFGQLCPFLISHSSFLIPHSSLPIPHSSLKPSAPPISKKFSSPPCNLF